MGNTMKHNSLNYSALRRQSQRHFAKIPSTTQKSGKKNNHVPKYERKEQSKKDIQLTHLKNKQSIVTAKERKRFRNDPDTLAPVISTSKEDTRIKQSIRSAESAHDLLSILRNNTIKDTATYGLAMQLCSKNFNDFNSGLVVLDIMKLMTQKTTCHHVIQFNIFFNCMAKADFPDSSMKYLTTMINKFGIVPDIICINTLIKGCRHRGQYTDAEYYWNLLSQYKLSPTTVTYTEMLSVYAKARKMDAATQLFTEYKKNIADGKLEASLPTYTAYLNVFGSVGDGDGMENVIRDMENSVGVDLVATCSVMAGYICARQPRNAIQAFDQWVSNGGSPNRVMCNLKCVALCHIVKDDTDIINVFELREAEYNKLKHVIYNELQTYKVTIDAYAISTQLTAAIALYHNVNPIKIVEIFGTLEKYISYLSRNEQHIDLHLFQKLQAQFILRYLIGFKIKELLTMTKSNTIKIICGKGKSSNGHANHRHALLTFVRQELLKYEPGITSTIHATNKGTLVVDKKYLISYLNQPNFASNKLTHPSNDWYWDDVRKE